jgi:hypothetical protein
LKNSAVTITFFVIQALTSCHTNKITELIVYPDSVLNDVSRHPVGINVNYFMDDDNYLKPKRRTADALKEMGVKYLRYPGGNKSDLYLFSVPPWEKSIPTLARAGKGAADYDRVIKDNKEYRFDVLDFDEFIALCQEVGAEPVVVVAADEYLVNYPAGTTVTDKAGLITNAVEWVRYSNIRQRYNVKYWMIGNECWHKNNENSTPEIYARDVVDFSRAMKAVDPSIYIIPNGNSVEFFKKVLTIAGNDIDYLCLSNYPVWNYTSGYVSYRDTLRDLLGSVQHALTAMDEINREDGIKKMKLIVAEYGPFDWANKWPFINDMGHNLCNFEITGELLKIPEIEFSLFWNTRWIDNDSIDNSVFDALDKNGNFNANGLGLMIWGNWLGKKMVATTGTVHIRSFASFSPDENVLYVYLLNKNHLPVRIQLYIDGYKIAGIEKSGQLYGNGPDDMDPVWNDNLILTKEDLRKLELPRTSISVIRLRTIKN